MEDQGLGKFHLGWSWIITTLFGVGVFVGRLMVRDIIKKETQEIEDEIESLRLSVARITRELEIRNEK